MDYQLGITIVRFCKERMEVERLGLRMDQSLKNCEKSVVFEDVGGGRGEEPVGRL